MIFLFVALVQSQQQIEIVTTNVTNPGAMAFWRTGELYFVDGNSIKRLSTGSATPILAFSSSVVATSIAFNFNFSRLYLSDIVGKQIRYFDMTSLQNMPFLTTLPYSPSGIAFDQYNNLLVRDHAGGRIVQYGDNSAQTYVFDKFITRPTAISIAKFKGNTYTFNFTDLVRDDRTFLSNLESSASAPIAFDCTGNLYIALTNGTMLVVSLTGSVLKTIDFDGAPAAAIAISFDGFVYVSQPTLARIVRAQALNVGYLGDTPCLKTTKTTTTTSTMRTIRTSSSATMLSTSSTSPTTSTIGSASSRSTSGTSISKTTPTANTTTTKPSSLNATQTTTNSLNKQPTTTTSISTAGESARVSSTRTNQTGIIIGCVVGGLLLVAIVIIVIVACRVRHRHDSSANVDRKVRKIFFVVFVW